MCFFAFAFKRDSLGLPRPRKFGRRSAGDHPHQETIFANELDTRHLDITSFLLLFHQIHIDLSTEPLTLVIANDLTPAVASDLVKEVAISRAHNGKPVVFTSAGPEAKAFRAFAETLACCRARQRYQGEARWYLCARTGKTRQVLS